MRRKQPIDEFQRRGDLRAFLEPAHAHVLHGLTSSAFFPYGSSYLAVTTGKVRPTAAIVAITKSPRSEQLAPSAGSERNPRFFPGFPQVVVASSRARKLLLVGKTRIACSVRCVPRARLRKALTHAP